MPLSAAEDKSRVFLHGNMRDNYINAVYVQGFKKPDAFIATEAPLPARRSIFWQMIIQKQSQTIVVMKDLAPEDVRDETWLNGIIPTLRTKMG